MSSTDTDLDNVLVAFFEQEFVTAAQRLAERSVRLLESAPNNGCATYYTPRQKRTMEPADFEWDLGNVEEVKQALRELWNGSEADVLSDLSDRILALAPRYASVEEVEEVSPFIYVMF
jgi:hypothetical protein